MVKMYYERNTLAECAYTSYANKLREMGFEVESWAKLPEPYKLALADFAAACRDMTFNKSKEMARREVQEES